MSGLIGFLIIGLYLGGFVCLLWGEECPPRRFWTGVALVGFFTLIVLTGIASTVLEWFK